MSRIEEPADRAWGRVVYRWRWTIVVLSVLPATPARVAVALTVWIGAAATALGLVLFAEILD